MFKFMHKNACKVQQTLWRWTRAIGTFLLLISGLWQRMQHESDNGDTHIFLSNCTTYTDILSAHRWLIYMR